MIWLGGRAVFYGPNPVCYAMLQLYAMLCYAMLWLDLAIHSTCARTHSVGMACETKHKHHYTPRQHTPACDWSVLRDYGSRSAHGSSHNPPQPRHLDADGPSGLSKIGELAAKTVPKPCQIAGKIAKFEPRGQAPELESLSLIRAGRRDPRFDFCGISA